MKDEILEVKKVGYSKVSTFLKTRTTANALISHPQFREKISLLYFLLYFPQGHTKKRISGLIERSNLGWHSEFLQDSQCQNT